MEGSLSGFSFAPRPGGLRRLTNIIFFLVNTTLAAALPVTTFGVAVWANERGIGLLNQLGNATPYFWIVAITVLARSLSQYGFHRTLHAIPFLWAIHRVHHSDMHFDLSTGLRFHPLELIANVTFLIPIVVLLGLDPLALIVFETGLIFTSVLTHINLKIPYKVDRAFRLLLITPRLHRLHHSAHRPGMESNFGADFSIWDRLLGTYYWHGDQEPDGYACGTLQVTQKQAESFEWQFISPLIYWQSLVETARLKRATGE